MSSSEVQLPWLEHFTPLTQPTQFYAELYSTENENLKEIKNKLPTRFLLDMGVFLKILGKKLKVKPMISGNFPQMLKFIFTKKDKFLTQIFFI